MLKLKINISGLDEEIQKYVKAEERLSNLAPLWEALMREELFQAQRRIDEGGDPPWLPTKYPSNEHPMLKRTGRLYQSLDPNQPITVTSSGASFVDDVFYAKFMQFGTAGRELKGGGRTGEIASREFLYIDDNDEAFIEDAVYEYVTYGTYLGEKL